MSDFKSKTFFGKAGVVFALAAVLVGAPLAASAATYTVGSSGEPYNQTLYYGTPRDHAGGSGNTYTLSTHSGFCASTFWMALRNAAGDSTNRANFTSTGVTRTLTWWTGGLAIPAGRYYVTARNDCAGMPGATYSWNGSLKIN